MISPGYKGSYLSVTTFNNFVQNYFFWYLAASSDPPVAEPLLYE